MNQFWFYPIHLSIFTAGILVLNWMHRRKIRGEIVVMATVILSIGMLSFLSVVSNPHGNELFSDFFRAYYSAGETVLHAPEEMHNLVRANYFVNLPVLAWLFVPFALLTSQGLSAIFFTILGLAATGLTWWMLVGITHLNKYRAALLLFIFAANGPLCYNFKEGNTSQMVLAMVVTTFLLLRWKREYLAGLLLGSAAVIKLPLLLFGVYFVARGRWRVVWGIMTVLVTLGLVSVALFGWQLNLQWYTQCIQPFTANPMGAYNVQSIYGFLARLQFGDLYLTDWNPHKIEPQYQFLMMATVVSTYAVSVLVMAKKNVRAWPSEIAQELEYLIVLVLALVASPMTWSHYYLWLLFPAAFLIGRTEHFPDDKITRGLGWVSLALASLPVLLPYTRHPIVRGFFVKFFLSHFLLAGFLMFALLLRARWKIAFAGESR